MWAGHLRGDAIIETMNDTDEDGWEVFDEDAWKEEVIQETEYVKKTELTPGKTYVNIHTGEVQFAANGEPEIHLHWKDKAWDAVMEEVTDVEWQV